tara:strand:+ start:3326 stop:3718 length:393 start_codon:yes stop_codon:yes gene_type:complete
MQIAYDPDAPPEFQYTVSPHSLPRKAAVDAMRNWCAPEELSAFAVARHGFMNSDSFFGITYPTDLDEWDRASGESIPDGYVEALAGYGDPHSDGLLILEAEYLELLRQFLLLVRLPTHAQELATVIEKGG